MSNSTTVAIWQVSDKIWFSICSTCSRLLQGISLRAEALISFRILVADDHPMIASGVRQALSQLAATVEVASTPEGVRKLVAERTYDLVVLDISFRDSSTTGFHLLRELRQTNPGMQVLFLSMYDDDALQETAKREGARGFVSKMEIGPRLAEAAQHILSGAVFFPPATVRRASMPSIRQLQVSELFRQGLHEKEVATKLGVSVSMVQTHAREAKRTLKARSLMQLVAIFVEKGLRFLPNRKR